MKHIDADRLKTEIGELDNQFRTGNYYLDNSEQAVGYQNALTDICGIIDSLKQEQQEKPVPKDLEEAAWDCVLDSVDVNNPVLLPKYKELLTYLFIAGAKWQAEKDTRDMCMSDNRHFEKVYQLGKKDMKEQMMKEAVEGTIYPLDQEIWCNLDKFPELKDGGKVRVIVLKKED